LDEEQRLFYVALTRARDTLDVYAPARLPTHPTSFLAKHVIAKPSRFLTPAARETMDAVDTAASDAVASPAPAEGMPMPAAPRIRLDAFEDLFA
jgi:DNA helicase-2/ATP-dependent DNA helicase PcrA